MDTKIYIVDEIMGRGKTSAAINHINSAPDDEHFLVITPYKDEITRYISECRNKRFVQPKYNDGTVKYTSKLDSIKEQIRSGRNIVSTHALFQKFDDEVIDLCKELNYTLIMDEVADVVDDYMLSKDDFKLLLDGNRISVNEETGEVFWIDESYGKDEFEARFEDIRNLCNLGSLCYYKGNLFIWLFPIEVFKAFSSVYIMTYMFNAQIQRYYYDYYNLQYTYIHIAGNSLDTYRFSLVEDINTPKRDYSTLIHVLENEKLNSIGEYKTNLSSSWYEKNANTPVMKKLKNNTYNFYRHITGSKQTEFYWCTFKDYERQLASKGFMSRFLPINTRSTNNFKDCTNVAYLVNRYLRPTIKNFFLSRGVTVDEDGYALSEMLQFIWRSAVREYREINVYIPSSRMRNLLLEWIEENSN